MRVLLTDGNDNTLKVIEAIEVSYEPSEKAMYINTSDTLFKIPKTHEIEFKEYVWALYEMGIADISSKKSYYCDSDYEDEDEDYY